MNHDEGLAKVRDVKSDDVVLGQVWAKPRMSISDFETFARMALGDYIAACDDAKYHHDMAVEQAKLHKPMSQGRIEGNFLAMTRRSERVKAARAKFAAALIGAADMVRG